MEHTWAQEAASSEGIYPDKEGFTQTRLGGKKWKCPLCEHTTYTFGISYHASKLHYKCEECGDYFLSLNGHYARGCPGN